MVQSGVPDSRSLILLCGWMMSQEQHIEKYREFWFERGFDVLSVRAMPHHLLVPYFGGRKNALEVYKFLSTVTPRYDKVIVHAFSVGGYQLSEIVHLLNEKCQNGDKDAHKIYDAVKGYILDSFAYPDICSYGTAQAITQNPILQSGLSKIFQSFFWLTKPYTVDRYQKLFDFLSQNEKFIPGKKKNPKFKTKHSNSRIQKQTPEFKTKNQMPKFQNSKQNTQISEFKTKYPNFRIQNQIHKF